MHAGGPFRAALNCKRKYMQTEMLMRALSCRTVLASQGAKGGRPNPTKHIKVYYTEDNGYGHLESEEVIESSKNVEEVREKWKSIMIGNPDIQGYQIVEVKADGSERKVPSKFHGFAKGGVLDKEFKFDKNFVIYVPSTSNVGDKISSSEMGERVSEVEELVANEFGGFTKTETDGGYKASSGDIVEEDIVKVSVFSTDEAWEKNEKRLIRAIKIWAKEWGQEAIGFEYEGDLYYIDAKGKMAHGGKTNEEILAEDLKERAPQFRRIDNELRKFNTKNPNASVQETLEFLHEKMSSMEGDFQTNLMRLYVIRELDRMIQEGEELSNLARGGKTMDDKVSDKIRLLRKEGKPQDQAIAIALSMRDKGKLAHGGTMTPSDVVALLTDEEVAKELVDKMFETLESVDFDVDEKTALTQAKDNIEHSRKMLIEILEHQA